MAAGVASVGVLEAVLRLRDTMSPALDNVAKRMRRFGGQMQRAGKQLSASFTLPIVGAAFAAVQAGESIDKAMRTIAIGTGAAGETLEGLKDSFNAVFSTVPQSADTVATVLADLNTVTAATGPTLERLAVALLDSSRVLGEEAAPNALKFARTLEQFAIPAEHGVEVLDMFFATSQRTGAGLGDLIQQAGTFGVVMKNVGFSLDESVALFGALSKGSIAVTRVMPGLNKAFRTWAGEGLDVKAMLVSTIESMKNAASRTESLNIATQAFGAEGAARLNDAVLEGKFNLEAMTAAVEGTAGAIAESTADTMTFSEHLGVLRNQATTALAPFGNELKRALEGFMPVVQSVAATLNGWATAFAELSTPTKNTILAVGAFVAALGPVILAVGAISLSIGSLIPILTSFGAFLVGTSSSVGALAGAFALLMTWPGALVAAVVLLTLKFEPFRKLLKATARLIMTGVVAAFAKLREWIGKAADTVGGFLGGLAKFIPGGAAVARAMGRLTAGMDAMSSSMGDSSGAVEDVEASVEELGEELDWTGGRLPPVVDGVVGLGDAAGTSSEEVQKLADTLSDAGLAGDVRTLTAAWESLDPTMQQNEHTLKRVSERALALIGRGATLTGEVAALGMAAFVAREEGIVPLADGLDGLEIQLGDQTVAFDRLGSEMIWATQNGFGPMIATVDQFRDGIVQLEQPISNFHEALGQTPGFFDTIKTSMGGFLEGLTGGQGLQGFFTNFGAGVVGGLGEILSGGITSLLNVGTQLAIKGLIALGGKLVEGFGKIWQGVRGLFGRTAEDNIRITGERLGFAIGEGLQTTIAQTATAIGHDYTAFLLHLGDITDAQGGVMVAGFQTVARTGRDLFSMVQEGRITTEQAMGALGPVLADLAANFDQAGEHGQIQFIELIQVASQMGVSLETLRGLVGTLADDALATTLNRAVIDANGNIRDLGTSIQNVPRDIHVRIHVPPVPRISIPPITASINYSHNIPETPDIGVAGFQRGSDGFRDFGRGTLAVLHGREAVVRQGDAVPGTDALAREIAALRRDLSTDRAFQSQLVPKMLTAALQQQGALS